MQTEKTNNLLTFVYFQLKILNFFFFLIQNIHKKTKKLIKNRTYWILYIDKNKKRLDNITNKEKIYEKIDKANIKHLNDWNFDQINLFSNIYTVKNFMSSDLKQEGSYFLKSNVKKKENINLSYRKNFKEFTKIKLPQKINKQNSHLNQNEKINMNQFYLLNLKIFYKIPITYFSSSILNTYYPKNNLKNLSLSTEKNFQDLFINQISNSTTKSILFNFIELTGFHLQKSFLLKKILFKIYENDSYKKKIKNCKYTTYVVVNVNIFFEKLHFLGKKKKILKIIKFYENSNKYQTSIKQFLPYGDIYLIFNRHKINQK
nr:hypothetical protein CcurKRNrm3_p015 [Cryptomonas curvata]